MIKRYQPHMYPGCDDVCSSEGVAELEEELSVWKSEYLKVDEALKVKIDMVIALEKQLNNRS